MNLTEDQARARLESTDNLANRFGKNSTNHSDPAVLDSSIESTPQVNLIPKKHQGQRPPGLPQFIRTEIATLARMGVKETAIADAFEVSQSTVSNCKSGKRAMDEESIEKKLSPVRDRALDRLMASLNLLTDDKMDKCDAKELASVAQSMSKVVEHSLPKDMKSNGANIQLTVYAPTLKQENSYNSIEVG